VIVFHDNRGESETALYRALNRVIVPERHPHRNWEYPATLLALAPLLPDAAVLCVGAMWDSLALYLCRTQRRFVAVDLAPPATMACWFGEPLPEGCEVLSGPAEEVLPKFFADGEFDCAFCISTLEHIEMPARAKVWSELCRVSARRVVATVDYTACKPPLWDMLNPARMEEMTGVRGPDVYGDGWQPLQIIWEPG
jgi:hypothetical protein